MTASTPGGKLPQSKSGVPNLLILGAISIVFGLLLLGNIGAATLVVPFVIGIFGIVGGIAAIIRSFRLR